MVTEKMDCRNDLQGISDLEDTYKSGGEKTRTTRETYLKRKKDEWTF